MMTMSPGRRVGNENFLDVEAEAFAIDRAIDEPWGFDPVVAQGGEEGRRVPAAMRHLGGEPPAQRRPSAQRRHVGLGPSLVDEDQARRIDPVSDICIHWARRLCDVGTIVLAGRDGFFCSSSPRHERTPRPSGSRPAEPRSASSRDQPAQGEVLLLGSAQTASRDARREIALRLVAAHLAGRDATRLPLPPHPVDRRAHAHTKPRRRLPPRQPTALNRRNHPLAKIHRIRFAHPMLASSPASMLNLICASP